MHRTALTERGTGRDRGGEREIAREIKRHCRSRDSKKRARTYRMVSVLAVLSTAERETASHNRVKKRERGHTVIVSVSVLAVASNAAT